MTLLKFSAESRQTLHPFACQSLAFRDASTPLAFEVDYIPSFFLSFHASPTRSPSE